MNAWLYYGGGMELWRELYESFNLIPAAAGNTGVQMAGWFNREIKTVADLKGLKILTVLHAAITMFCRSTGNSLNACLFIIASMVEPGSCQPG
jgi:TRAP-type mannitol/chloroaromatic compound transport system substrate-binding protein